MKGLLPHFPPDVLVQWFYDHWGQIDGYSWLDYRRLRFREEHWPTAAIPFSTENGDTAYEGYARYFRGQRDSPRMNRLAEYIASAGTWPVAPIFLWNGSGEYVFPNGYRCVRPYHLLEGSHRVAVMSVLKDERPLRDRHRVWIAEVLPS